MTTITPTPTLAETVRALFPPPPDGVQEVGLAQHYLTYLSFLDGKRPCADVVMALHEAASLIDPTSATYTRDIMARLVAVALEGEGMSEGELARLIGDHLTVRYLRDYGIELLEQDRRARKQRFDDYVARMDAKAHTPPETPIGATTELDGGTAA